MRLPEPRLGPYVVVWGPIVSDQEYGITPFIKLDDCSLDQCEFSTSVESIASVVQANDEERSFTTTLINPNFFSVIRQYD